MESTKEMDDTEFDKQLNDRFAQLPPVVQNAITSTDIEKNLRKLADTHKLHLDQWEKLENEVMLSLLGFQDSSDLSSNIQRVLNLPPETATALATDISHVVFEPIRAELEKQLDKPSVANDIPSAPPITPATPPTPKPTEKAQRASLSDSYAAKTTSHTRTDVGGDPYRETAV